MTNNFMAYLFVNLWFSALLTALPYGQWACGCFSSFEFTRYGEIPLIIIGVSGQFTAHFSVQISVGLGPVHTG
ncbi:hypothetical protein [Photobacterium ganghwense]|uniref:hypothetical protein n=1 Tax=Photobacterium ganghwense TaxID=320778 RepID=UPI0039EFD0CB